MNTIDFKRAVTAQPLFDGFWTFDSTASTLSVTITTSNPSEIVIVWGDNTTSTVASSPVAASHTYNAA